MAEQRNRSPFGQRMLEARTRAGLTQVQASEALGISQGTLAELERKGEGSTLVVHFAKLYRCAPEWLALGDGTMESGLSPDAIRMARRLDELRDDRQRYRVALATIEGLLFSTPESEDETDEEEEAPAPAPRPTSKRQPHR